MSKKTLGERVTELESELESLKQRIPPEISGWQSIVGAFASDPAFDEAMSLGREYRESQRPQPRPSRKRVNAHS